jgi:hypothetical protein
MNAVTTNLIYTNRLKNDALRPRYLRLLRSLGVNTADQLFDLFAAAVGTLFNVAIMLAEAFVERKSLFALFTYEFVRWHLLPPVLGVDRPSCNYTTHPGQACQ